MKGRAALIHLAIILGGAMLLCSTAFAESPPPPAQPTAVAQAAPAPAPAKPADQTALSERVGALEKENVVLREDMGKARLDVKSDLETLAKRQAEAIARLNQQLAETQAKLEAEQARRERQNRNLWIAIGAVAVGWLVSD